LLFGVGVRQLLYYSTQFRFVNRFFLFLQKNVGGVWRLFLVGRLPDQQQAETTKGRAGEM